MSTQMSRDIEEMLIGGIINEKPSDESEGKECELLLDFKLPRQINSDNKKNSEIKKPPEQTEGKKHMKLENGSKIASNSNLGKSKKLLSKGEFDKLQPISEKAVVGSTALVENSDSGESETDVCDNHILSKAPNLYKQIEGVMSERFLKFIPSEYSDWLQENETNVFLLLIVIAKQARRSVDVLDGLEIGDAIISRQETSKIAGLTQKEYRNAKIRGEELGLWEEVYNQKWSQKKYQKRPEFQKRQKRAIKRAIKSCVVNLCNSRVFDINPDVEGQQSGQQRANKGPQTRMNKNEKEEERRQPQTPSTQKSEKKVVVSFSGKKEIHKKVHLSEKELEECIKRHGNREKVLEVIENILSWPEKKYSIKNWCDLILKWEMKSFSKEKRKENENYGKNLDKKYSNVSHGWRPSWRKNSIKDEYGVLFECIGNSFSESYFISENDVNFIEKNEKFMLEKSMGKP